jgi:hypothetical protein
MHSVPSRLLVGKFFSVSAPQLTGNPHTIQSPVAAALARRQLNLLQRTVGNRAVVRLLQQPGAIQRFENEGPNNIKDPVHETITEEALIQAGLLKPGQIFSSPEAWEYIRGIMWNDDPQGQWFDRNKSRTDDFSSGTDWYIKFRLAEHKAARGRSFGPGDNLLPRSHFGDLQFLHSMGSRDGELPEITGGKMLMWAEFTYKVAVGVIPGSTKLGAVPVAGIPELFPKQKAQSVSSLFGIEEIGDVRQRAAGSLMHMIQDSYASGHTEREPAGGGRQGAIKSYHSYSKQDHKKHSHDDAFQGEGSDREKLKSTPGAQDAVAKSAQVLKFIAARADWEVVHHYLSREVFQLAVSPQPSGPGAHYQK